MIQEIQQDQRLVVTFSVSKLQVTVRLQVRREVFVRSQRGGPSGQRRRKWEEEKAVLPWYGSRRMGGSVRQDPESPKVKSNLRKGTNPLRPSRRPQFGMTALQSRQDTGRKPFVAVIVPTHPHEHNFFAPKFEDRNQEDTLERERMTQGFGSTGSHISGEAQLVAVLKP